MDFQQSSRKGLQRKLTNESEHTENSACLVTYCESKFEKRGTAHYTQILKKNRPISKSGVHKFGAPGGPGDWILYGGAYILEVTVWTSFTSPLRWTQFRDGSKSFAKTVYPYITSCLDEKARNRRWRGRIKWTHKFSHKTRMAETMEDSNFTAKHGLLWAFRLAKHPHIIKYRMSTVHAGVSVHSTSEWTKH